MFAKTTIQDYFEAFNKYDPQAVSALFARGGKYVDSAIIAGVEGAALEKYLQDHYAAFPDATYQVLRTISDSEGMAACEWVFKGTNTGPLGKFPATHRGVEVQGASILQLEGNKIAWLHGYYDRQHLLKQIGR
jgi:steroid delta-isomerase-like uncharacterized protein